MSPSVADCSINSYLKMISSATGGTVINYSDRFTLSGMTGTFPANVQAGLQTVTGTAGPSTQNNIDTNAQAVPADGQTGGPYAVAYTAQTGLTKYAPMQKKPGTKITAKSPTPQYPTSSVDLAKTILPTPSQVTTMTVSATYSVSSRENTVSASFEDVDTCSRTRLTISQASPAPGPMNDMQKYLARWRD